MTRHSIRSLDTVEAIANCQENISAIVVDRTHHSFPEKQADVRKLLTTPSTRVDGFASDLRSSK